MRIDGRKNGQLRPVRITPGFLKHPAGSALIEFGNTRVICAASIMEEVPSWMRSQKVPGGWVTGEYQMIPASTPDRTRREINHPSGRTQEIQRLIGRCLRAAVNLGKLGPRSIYIDCEVIDADGGTRCASITGGMVALQLAIRKLMKDGKLAENPILCNIAAVSVGVVKGEVLLDLCYQEDSSADVDMNLIMTDQGRIVEVQATGEESTFSKKEFDSMQKLAEKGINHLFELQKKALK
ncbi:MAG TPA: ribonuclease PH [Lentisphaeria bacterium]|nr:MAG: ribonuclease PH [Lentisphaerae bacterium GWF2_49_21]HBC87887.1 ribonuclease PH [Lentisphaeria bacterium]